MEREVKTFFGVDDADGPTEQFVHGRADDLHFVQPALLQAPAEGLHGRVETQGGDGRPVEDVAYIVAALFTDFGSFIYAVAAHKLPWRYPGPAGDTAGSSASWQFGRQCQRGYRTDPFDGSQTAHRLSQGRM